LLRCRGDGLTLTQFARVRITLLDSLPEALPAWRIANALSLQTLACETPMRSDDDVGTCNGQVIPKRDLIRRQPRSGAARGRRRRAVRAASRGTLMIGLSLAEGLFQSVVAGLVLAFLLGAWALLWGPLRNRLQPVILRKTHDHGVKLLVYGTSEEMGGLRPEEMLGVDVAWLADTDFFLPRGIPGPGPHTLGEWADWAHRHGAESVGWRHVLIRIQATQDRTVLVMKPRVSATHKAVTGGAVLCPAKEPGGNGLMVRQFHIDLDKRPPRVDYYAGNGPGSPQFVMRRGDSEAFVVIAHATAGRYEWTLDIPVVVDGETFHLRADDHGRPFVLVGPDGQETMWWDFGQLEWRKPEW